MLKAVQLHSMKYLTTMVSKDLVIIAISILMATTAIRTWYKPNSATPVCRVIWNSGLSISNVSKSVKPNSDQNKLSRLLSTLQNTMFGKIFTCCTVSELNYYTCTSACCMEDVMDMELRLLIGEPTNGLTDRKTHNWTDKHWDRQTDRQADDL